MEKENEYQNEEQQNVGCLSGAGGCLVKVIGAVVFFIVMFVGNTLIRTCTRQQMRQAQKEYYSNMPAEDRLQNGVKELRATLPHAVDDVTTCTDVELTADAYTYVYTVDKSIDFSTVNFATFDSETKAGIKANKQKLALVAQLCEETGRKICYRYVSATSGATHTIVFLATELL